MHAALHAQVPDMAINSAAGKLLQG